MISNLTEIVGAGTWPSLYRMASISLWMCCGRRNPGPPLRNMTFGVRILTTETTMVSESCQLQAIRTPRCRQERLEEEGGGGWKATSLRRRKKIQVAVCNLQHWLGNFFLLSSGEGTAPNGKKATDQFGLLPQFLRRTSTILESGDK
jgi:hypothetical protein